MNIERNCQTCKYYKDGYCENLELKPCYPQKGCDDFSQEISQELCEDCVSRQAAINACLDGWNKDFKEIVTDIRNLPPVTPTHKTGKWVLTDDNMVYCSECEDSYYPRPIDASWKYCPNCGAKMPDIPTGSAKYEAKVITRGNCMKCGKELTEGLFFCKECEAESEDK